MRFFLALIIFVFLCIAGIFFAGPLMVQPPLSRLEPVTAVEKAVDIGEYVKLSEMLFQDELKPGMAKKIIWYEQPNVLTSISIVYLHGWSASPNDTAPFPQMLARRLHANLFSTRFTAHGLRTGQAFQRLQLQSLVDDAREALAIGRRLGEQVIMVGTSTGATLAVELALENLNKPDLAAMVLLSPNFMPAKKMARFATGPLGKFWATLFVGSEYSFRAESPEHEANWTTHYSSEGLVAMLDLVNYVNTQKLRQIQIPTLILYTHLDNVVSVPMMRRKFRELGSPVKEMIDLKESTRHELVGDILVPGAATPAADETVRFLHEALRLKP